MRHYSACIHESTPPPVCVLPSPFPAGRLSEVLLGKLQHVIFSVLQGTFIQISISKAINRDLLKGKEWQWKTTWIQFDRKTSNLYVCVSVSEPQSFDLSHAQPWWMLRRQRQLMTQRTVPLHLGAPTFGPVEVTGSQEERRDGRTRRGMRRSGRTRRQTSSLMHRQSRGVTRCRANTWSFSVPKQAFALLQILIAISLSSTSRSAFQLKWSALYLQAFLYPFTRCDPPAFLCCHTDNLAQKAAFSLIVETQHTWVLGLIRA